MSYNLIKSEFKYMTCISYLNKIFSNFPHLLETCSVYYIFKYKSDASCLILDNIWSKSLLNFKILLCQKITVKISSSHSSSLAKDKSNFHCVITKLSFVLQMSFSFFNESTKKHFENAMRMLSSLTLSMNPFHGQV